MRALTRLIWILPLAASCAHPVLSRKGARHAEAIPRLNGVVAAALDYQLTRNPMEAAVVLLDTALGPQAQNPDGSRTREEVRSLPTRFQPRSRSEIDQCIRERPTCGFVHVTGLRAFEGAVHVSATWAVSRLGRCGHSYTATVILRPSVGVWEVVGVADEERGSCGAGSSGAETAARP